MRGILQAVVQIFVVSVVQGENRQRIWGKKQHLTKLTHVVRMNSKNVPDVIQGMKDCLKLMRTII